MAPWYNEVPFCFTSGEGMQTRSNAARQTLDLQQAMAMLIRNQAAFVESSIEFQRRWREDQEQWVKAQERFARIERDLDQIKAILSELPEAIRQKIGFKAK